MITAHDVSVRIGARELLHEASFRVDTGMRIGLVGRNGAGKTTLLKLIGGEIEGDKGKRSIQPGTKVFGLSPLSFMLINRGSSVMS